MEGWVLKVLTASIPLLIGALVTVGWQNSHTLSRLTDEYEDLRVEMERTKASLEPGRTIMLRLDQNESEIKHLRGLIELQMGNRPAPPVAPAPVTPH